MNMQCTSLIACLLCLPSAVLAQATSDKASAQPDMQAMMAAWEKAAAPGAPQRQLMEQFAGTWSAKNTMWMDAASPPMVETGTMVNTPIFGGRQLRMEYRGTVMGKPFEGVGYSGYDNVKGKYLGSWIDNMSTGQFLAEGDYDPATRTYTYRGSMPDPMQPGATTAVRETVRVVDRDHHVMEYFETHDGQERKSMQIEYTRSK